MHSNEAFKCSRCGKYEYETELAEKVCKNCASDNVESVPSASHNTGIPKLPTVESCINQLQFPGRIISSDTIRDIKKVHTFISRQLRAGA